MRGHTVVMNASATIKPNNPYNIKLVIGDYNDSKYDSAVFIEAGSFGNFLDLGEDFSICNGEMATINSGFTNTLDFEYEWKRDNIIITGETSPTIDISSIGTYDVNIKNKTTNCIITDQIVVSDLTINNPPDLTVCDNGVETVFDLTQNSIKTIGLDPTRYNLTYHSSLSNLNNNVPINPALLTSYLSLGGATIYGRVTNIISTDACIQTIDFKLQTNTVTATKPTDVAVCENTPLDIPAVVESQILNGLNSVNYTVIYYTSLLDAQNDTNAIVTPLQYSDPSNSNSFSIWARLTEDSLTQCFDITDFTVNVTPNPPIDTLPTVSYTHLTLPTIYSV